MSLPKSELRYTVEEYLALEREAEERHEYLDGQICAMAGESPAHADICVNIVRELSSQLKGKPCRVWTKDTKVRSGPLLQRRRATKGLFSYPDVLVVCGEPKFLDEHQDVLLNPTIIIEVSSPSTENFDYGKKFWRYRQYLPSLTDYLLVDQTVPLIGHYVRRSADEWTFSSASELEGRLYIASIDCTLEMAEVYDRVIFPDEELEELEEELPPYSPTRPS